MLQGRAPSVLTELKQKLPQWRSSSKEMSSAALVEELCAAKVRCCELEGELDLARSTAAAGHRSIEDELTQNLCTVKMRLALSLAENDSLRGARGLDLTHESGGSELELLVKHESLNRANTELRRELQDLRKQTAPILDESNALRQQLAAIRKPSLGATDLSSLKRHNESLMLDLDDLNQRNSALNIALDASKLEIEDARRRERKLTLRIKSTSDNTAPQQDTLHDFYGLKKTPLSDVEEDSEDDVVTADVDNGGFFSQQFNVMLQSPSSAATQKMSTTSTLLGEFSHLRAEISELEVNSHLTRELLETKSSNHDLMRQLGDLQMRYLELQRAKPPSVGEGQLAKKLAHLQEEFSSLTSEHVALKKAHGDLGRHQACMFQFEMALDRPSGSSNVASEAAKGGLRRSNGRLQAEIGKLRDELEKAAATCSLEDDLTLQLMDSRMKLAEFSTTMLERKQKNGFANKNDDDEHASVLLLNERELVKLTRREVTRLQNRVMGLEAEMAARSADHARRLSLYSQDVRHAVDVLASKTASDEEMTHQLCQCKVKVASLAAQNDELRHRLHRSPVSPSSPPYNAPLAN